MNAIGTFALIQIRRFFRDPVALFFTLLFPLIFLFVFGSIFRGSGDVSFDVAIINHSDSTFAKQFVEESTKDETFKRKDVASFDEAKTLMGRGEVDSIIELPENFGQPDEQGLPRGEMKVYYDEGNPQTGQTVASVMSSIMDEVNQQITKTEPLFSVKQASTATAGLTQFDYTISGLVGFSILSLGIFGLANQMPVEKKNGVLRRIRATPFSKGQMIIGTMIYYGLMGLLSIAIMLAVALTVFGFEMRGDWLNLTVFIVLGIVMLLGFGLLIGGWAKNVNQAAVLSNAVSFPMMFLSGAFFPRFLMPDWLQAITSYVPLTPVVDGIRYITTEGKTLLDLGPQLAVMAVVTVVVYTLAIRLFRWE